MMINNKKIITLLTHSGTMHADEVFATAILKIWAKKNDQEILIKRSRDVDEINSADIVYDVGGVYDQKTNRYDHHQKEGAGQRENGIPYASAGLVWKHFGIELCDHEIWQKIDTEIISIIDATDNGYHPEEKITKKNDIVLYDLIANLKPTWQEIKDNNQEEELLRKAFDQAVDICELFLARKIIWEEANKNALEICDDSYKNSLDKKIIVIEKAIDRAFLQNYFIKHQEPIFIISPTDFSANSNWRVVCIKQSEESFACRKPFPQNWRGLENENLAKETGIKESIFCHRAGFLFITTSKKSALEIAKIALEN